MRRVANSAPARWAAPVSIVRRKGWQQSTSRHAVGEISDSGRKIGGLVPLHDCAEIVVDKKGWTAHAVRHNQRSFAFAPGKGAGINATHPKTGPFPGRSLDLKAGEARVKARRQRDQPPPALAAAPAQPCDKIRDRRQDVGAVVPDIAPAISIVIDGIAE